MRRWTDVEIGRCWLESSFANEMLTSLLASSRCRGPSTSGGRAGPTLPTQVAIPRPVGMMLFPLGKDNRRGSLWAARKRHPKKEVEEAVDRKRTRRNAQQ